MQLTMTQEQVAQVVGVLKEPDNRSSTDASLARLLDKQSRFSGKTVDIYLTNQDAQRVRRILKANGRPRPMTPLPKELEPIIPKEDKDMSGLSPSSPVKTPLTFQERADGSKVWTAPLPPKVVAQVPEQIESSLAHRFGTPQPRPCVVCGTTYTPSTIGGKYCSAPCREKAEREKQREYTRRAAEKKKALTKGTPPPVLPAQIIPAYVADSKTSPTPTGDIEAGDAKAHLHKTGTLPWHINMNGKNIIPDDAIALGEWLVAAGRFAKEKGVNL